MGASPSLYDRPESIDHPPPKPVLQKITAVRAIGKRKVVLLGLDNSGKTTFVTQIARPVNDAIGGVPPPMKTMNMDPSNNDQYNLQILDLAGRIEDRSNWGPMILDKDVILFFIDTTEENTRRIEVIDVWIDVLKQHLKENPKKLLYFVGTKTDIECKTPVDWSTRKITLRRLNCQNGRLCHVFIKEVVKQLNAIVREYEKLPGTPVAVPEKKVVESEAPRTFCRWPW
jgi:GTPase SAR1 family protein